MTAAPDGPPGAGSGLRTTLRLAAPALAAVTERLWRTSDLTARYIAYLYAMHEVVRASVPLMETAALRCRTYPPGDRAAGGLRAYLADHIREERHHDEWLMDDLAAAGEPDPPTLLGRQPGPQVARLVGAQYYWIAHHSPLCLLGYIAALEANAPSPHLADRLSAATGLPDAAFRTVRHHAVVDGGHSDAVFTLLDRLPLTTTQARAVTVSALTTVTALIDLFETLGAPR